jgi:hypothetical protein
MASNKQAIAAKYAAKRNKALVANFKKATNEFHPYLDFIIDDKEVGHWWCRFRNIAGDHGEFTDGEYLIEMHADQEYPHSPPKFFVRTPNGVYAADRHQNLDVCLGNGHLHKEDYAAAQGGMMGFIAMTLNGFMNWRRTGVGYNLLNNDYFTYGIHESDAPNKSAKQYQARLDVTKDANMSALARLSREYNRKYFPEVMAQFDELPFHKALRALPTLGLGDLEADVRRAICG